MHHQRHYSEIANVLAYGFVTVLSRKCITNGIISEIANVLAYGFVSVSSRKCITYGITSVIANVVAHGLVTVSSRFLADNAAARLASA